MTFDERIAGLRQRTTNLREYADSALKDSPLLRNYTNNTAIQIDEIAADLEEMARELEDARVCMVVMT